MRSFAFMGLALTFSLHGFATAQTIKVDGSSTVYPITEAAAEEFQSSKKGKIKVTVGNSGTGGGFKKFCRGETDLQDASRPIQESEMKDCAANGVKYIELPIAFDAMAVVVHPSNDWLKEIHVDDLKKMWAPEAQGKITKWKQVNAKWPDQPLKLFGAGSDSGTFDYFTEAVVGKAKSSRGDYTASEDDNTLVQGVSKEKTALGYIPYAYYDSNKSKLKLVAIIGGDKAPKKSQAVLPSETTVRDGTYYPLARPIFIYLSEKSMAKPEVVEFTKFYLTNGSRFVREVKYVPLPDTAYSMGVKHVESKKLGTVFDGHPKIGMKIEDLMKLEARLDSGSTPTKKK